MLDLYAAFDIPETETFGSSYFAVRGLRRDSADIRNVDPDPNMLKFASSAANAYGNRWQAAKLLPGWVNILKPPGASVNLKWTRFFYQVSIMFFIMVLPTVPLMLAGRAGYFMLRSILFPIIACGRTYGGLNDYITRCQSVLQAGESDNEILIYWPIYDIWHNPAGMEIPLTVHNVDRWLHPTEFYKRIEALQNAGYSLDFASDKMLEQASGHNG